MASTTVLVPTTVTASSAAATSTGAADQGGIIDGANPIEYSASSPINLFIIQACIIIIFCRLLHWPLSKLGQPRVIAEVIGGVLLGPSVFMRIPGFQENIFPTAAMPVLNNVANVGLILFLFLIGLEVDTRMFRSNWRVALSVGFAGMVIPFGLGFAVAYGLYNQYRAESGLIDISFGTYGLFIGTALAITAFPVLCRILSELQLLATPVGVTVLAAGIGNDVTGWILLALSVALVNNSSGLTALYVLLTAVAWILFLTFAVRPVFFWILRRSGSFQNGPSPAIIALTLLLVLMSSWFTAAIGVHQIFGAFLVGLICPHEGGFAIKLTEKIEDLVTVLFLPLYFALSGLSTDLGLLNDGTTWGYVVAVIAIAFFGKIAGGMLAARACRLLWRESFTIGVLMSCKGLVELIVLNIGLQAHILSQKTFTIFVVMALVTTVATTPLALWLYPPEYRKKVEKWKRGEIDWDGKPLTTESQVTEERVAKTFDKFQTSKLLVHLRLDNLSSLFQIVALLGDARRPRKGSESPEENEGGSKTSETQALVTSDRLEVRGIRMVELTDRTSSVMQSAELDEFASQDAVFSAFQAFAQLHGVAVAGHLAAVPTSYYAETLIDHASETKSDLVLIPWSVSGSVTEDHPLAIPTEQVPHAERFSNRQHIDFVQSALRKATCTTGIFINRGLKEGSSSKMPMLTRRQTGISVQSGRDTVSQLVQPDKTSQRIMFPFIGGRDDQATLLLVLQLAHSLMVEATIVHMTVTTEEDGEAALAEQQDHSKDDGEDVSEKITAKERISGEITASDLELLSTAKRVAAQGDLNEYIRFEEVSVATPRELVDEAKRLVKQKLRSTKGTIDDIVVVGRSHECLRSLAVREVGAEKDFQQAIGVLGHGLVKDELQAGLLVIQAGPDQETS